DVPGPVVGTGAVVDETAVAELGEPPGKREVVQAHPRRYTGGARRRQHLEHMLDGRRVAPTLLGLDARPLDREAMVGEPVLRVQREVVRKPSREAVAVAARWHRAAALEREPVGCRSRAIGL